MLRPPVSRRLLVPVILLVLVAGGPGCSDSVTGLAHDDVARVGDTAIATEGFQQRLGEFAKELSGQVPDKTNDPAGYRAFEDKVLDYMVTLEIVRQKAGTLHITVADAEVQAKLEQMARQSFAGDLTKMRQSLQATGTELSTYRHELAEQMLIAKARQAVIASAPDPVEKEIAAYYREHAADYQQPESRTVRHILIAPRPAAGGSAPTDADWQATLERAEKVRAALDAGADFAEQARLESDDTSTKDAGGSLGTVFRRQTWPGFEEALWALPLNQISQPVKTQYGYELIQVTAVFPAAQKPLGEVRDTIGQKLRAQKQEVAWQSWLAKMKDELQVVIKPGMQTTTTS